MPRTPADYEIFNCWVDSGKSDDQIRRLIESPHWRSDVIEDEEYCGYICPQCHQDITIEACLGCRQTIRDDKSAQIGNLFFVALFLFTARECDPRCIPTLLARLNQ